MTLNLTGVKNFAVPTLDDRTVKALEEAAARCRINAVTMVSLADSGHPAGSLSSMDIYLAVYAVADLTPHNCSDEDRDYVAVSHGHTSPAAYAVLGELGFFDPLEAVANFRRCGSPYQGHVERDVPGIDWGSGNLGQGLSAGVGFALAQRARKNGKRTYVLMGDGGQTKGQSAEARRMAVKEGLNITALVDWNDIQISGRLSEVMPAHIPALWRADGWEVLECDGHSFRELYDRLRQSALNDRPTVILCRTVMGKGVPYMENSSEFHGKAPRGDLYVRAMKDLGGDPALLERARALRESTPPPKGRPIAPAKADLLLGRPRTYKPEDKMTDNRSAFGGALADVGEINCGDSGKTPLLVFDCDLAPSVKTEAFAAKCPSWFIQGGIQEHSTATAAGAASTAGVVSLWAGFGVFGLSEVYNQQRLNDINSANLKTVLTHVGLDVGEDGKTHQAIDYIGLLRNTFGWKLVVPTDPNQTDRATRWALGEGGCVCLAMGRSRLPVITGEDGEPFYGEGYEFQYGKADRLRKGDDCAIFALGAMAGKALKVRELLKERLNRTGALYALSSPLQVDDDALIEGAKTGRILTLEDHSVHSGMGSILAARMTELGLGASFRSLGVHKYGESGPSADILADMGLDEESIFSVLEGLFEC